ncbi:PQQ-dependent sugar dehydrogenase, partial [Salmonella enterica subsp. enterica serovar Infantis]
EHARTRGDRNHRMRAVRGGPDGYLSGGPAEADGQLLKVSPAATR